MIAYPPFPSYNGNVAQMIIQLLLWTVEIPLIAIANAIIAIAGGASTSASQSISAVLLFPGQIFTETENSFAGYGVFAPLIASLIWGISLITLVFLVIKAFQVGADELTNTE